MAVRLVVTFNAAAGQGAEQVGLHEDCSAYRGRDGHYWPLGHGRKAMAVRLVVTFNAAAGQGAEQVGLHIDLFEDCSAYRGRDGHYWPPPAQIRTRPTKASGSYLGCLTSKRSSGQG